MAELRILDPTWLRDKAALCRDLAACTKSEITAVELREIADEYESDAANIEMENRPVEEPRS